MVRRVTGSFTMKRRPDGGAVFLMKSATGECFEMEQTPDQVAALASALSPPVAVASPAAPEPEMKLAKSRKATA